MENKPYNKLYGTLAVSFAIMYATMFLNVARSEDIYLSLTRFYMALLMVAPMALLMLVSMQTMYKNKKLNYITAFSSCLIFVVALVFLRTQTLVNDKQYMQAMISHHSSAILTSSHANLQDEEVKQLADSIIQSQQREIQQMKQILKRLH